MASYPLEGKACSDGNPCTANETCTKAECKPAKNICECKADVDCAAKDDGDLCNGKLYCNLKSGACAPNPASVVNCQTFADGPCEMNTCEPATGLCVKKPKEDGGLCNGDGSLCTSDACKDGSCVSGVNNCICADDPGCAVYEDGDACNGTFFCDKVAKVCNVNPATVVDCPSSENTLCKKSLCDAKTGNCALTPVSQGKPCNDGVPCTAGDVCETGACKPGADLCTCKQDGDCAVKEDGDVCNGTLYCDKEILPWNCKVNPKTLVTCPGVDDTFCQKNTCQAKSGACAMAFLHVDEACNDGSPCTTAETCKAGACTDTSVDGAKPCADANPCTSDVCDKDKGCLQTANSAACSDDDACTAGDVCKDQKCVAKGKTDCDDKNLCSTDVCHKNAGCIHFFNSDVCDDGTPCTQQDACKSGACVPGQAVVCDDKLPCTLDTCNPLDGKCSFKANAPASQVCDDGIACTAETCDSVTGCASAPQSGQCSDGIVCTVDTCALGVGCVHAPDDAACLDSNPCTADACAATGCVQAAIADGSACSDGDACTTGDGCKAGVCAAGPKSAGCGSLVCKGQVDGVACDDGDACTAASTCLGKVCVAPVVSVEVTTVAGEKTGALLLDGKGKAATLPNVSSIAVDASGTVWLGEGYRHVIRRMTPLSTGTHPSTVTTVAGGVTSGFGMVDGKGFVARFNQPRSLAFLPDGSLAIVDGNNHRIRKMSPDGTVSTLAGSGKPAFADGKGAAAAFYNPSSIAIDGQGQIVVADSGNNRIRRIAADGTVTTLAGSAGVGKKDGLGTAATFNYPTGIALGPNGVLYVADYENNLIRRIALDGTVSTWAGATAGAADGKGTAAQFKQPYDIQVDPSGVAYVVDRGNHRIRRIAPDGTVTTLAGSTAGFADGSKALFNYPTRLAILPGGDLLLTDTGNDRVRRIRLRRDTCDDGKPCTVDVCDAGTGQCKAPALCDDGNPCTADTCDAAGACANKAVADGTACDDGDPCGLGVQCGGGLCGPAAKVATLAGKDKANAAVDGTGVDARFYRPEGIAWDANGSLVVADSYNYLIRRVAPDGTTATVSGSPWQWGGFQDGSAFAARFAFPLGVAVDAKGHVFVADASNNRIRRIAPDGSVTTFVGTVSGMLDGTGTAAQLKYPRGLVFDASGTLFFADTNNHIVRKVTPGGVVSLVAGTPGTAGFSDGPPNSGRLNAPAALAFDPAGNLYVADTSNHSIRRIEADGTVVTIAGIQQGFLDGVGVAGIRFSSPLGLAFDLSGNLYISDAGNHRIRVLYPNGSSGTVAGNGVIGSPDGIGTSAQFNYPSGLAFGPDGVLYVAGTFDSRIRTLQPMAKACSDGNACTADVCVRGHGCKNPALPGGAVCSDGATCTVGDACQGGACKPGNTAAGCVCKPDPSGGCDDGNPCTTDGCTPAKGCVTTPLADGPACEDGTACTAASACQGGTCQPEPGGYVVEPFAGADDGDIGSGSGKQDGFRRATVPGLAPARFHQPMGLAVDALGGLTIADRYYQLVRRIAPDGQVTTLAGRPWSDNAGAVDGPKFAASFNIPVDVGVDAAGNTYVADNANHRIRKVSPEGVVTTLAGSSFGYQDGKGTAAKFNSPNGLAVDALGTVYVADGYNNRIRKVAPDGQVTTVAGGAGNGGGGHIDGIGASAQFNNPYGIDFAPDGRLVVADWVNHSIRIVDPTTGSVTTLAGGKGEGWKDGKGPLGAKFSAPAAIKVDAKGFAYVSDYANQRIRRVAPDGTVTTIAGTGVKGNGNGAGTKASFVNPVGLALDAQGRLYVADGNHRIRRLVAVGATCNDGNPCTLDVCDTKLGCSHPVAPAAVACPDGGACSTPACDAATGKCTYAPVLDGTVCDAPGKCQQQCRAGSCQPAAVVWTRAGTGDYGSVDGPGPTARFHGPGAVAVDAQGNVFVADTQNNRIRKVAVDGTVTTLAGSSQGYAEGVGTAAKFDRPSGIAIDKGGVIYVADSFNHRIRRVLPDGTVSTLAGSASGYGDAASTLAKFNQPAGVAVDAAGAVFVADYANHMIRRIDPAGQVTTLAGGVSAIGLPVAGWVDGVGGNARLSQPWGITLGPGGVLYFTEADNGSVRKLDTDGRVTTIVGNYQGFVDGRGVLGPRLSSPASLAVLGDGSIAVADKGNHAIRRIHPDGSVVTLAGGSKGWLDGMGTEVKLSGPMGIALDKSGDLHVADTSGHRIRRLSVALSNCSDLAGVTRATAGKSCKVMQPQTKWTGVGGWWIDVTGGSTADAWKTWCDQTTEGGGWTRIDAKVTTAAVDLLKGASGRQLLKCSDTGLAYLMAPPTAVGWSWTTKAQVSGSWTANGVAVTCGGSPDFSTLGCGFGFGCASAAASVLPGLLTANQCASSSTASTSGAFSVCDAGNFPDYKVFVRAE